MDPFLAIVRTSGGDKVIEKAEFTTAQQAEAYAAEKAKEQFKADVLIPLDFKEEQPN